MQTWAAIWAELWARTGAPVASVASTRRLVRRLRALSGARPATKLKLAPAVAGDGSTQISQQLSAVVDDLRARGAQRVVVYGDRAFQREFAAAAPELAGEWASSGFDDLVAGAVPVAAVDLAGADAVVTGGAEVATQWRYALRRLHSEAPEMPVLWVADRFEFCRGTMAVPVEIEQLDALVLNHFEQFFGVKDPLLFKAELLAGKDVLQRTRILGPNESLLVRLGELAPERSGPVCLSVTIAHPSLTRGRHYRYRACADAFWKGSVATLHGGHKFFANPNKPKEHRLAESTIRRGRLVVTVPNYDLDMGSDASVTCTTGDAVRRAERDRSARVEAYAFVKPAASAADRRFFGISYRGYGTSFWYGLEEGVEGPRGRIDCLSANHLGTVDVADRVDARMSAAEVARLAAVEARSFRVHPHAVAILGGDDDLELGFSFDSCNPPITDLDVDLFDAAGVHLAAFAFAPGEGVTFTDALVAACDHPRRAAAALALVTPAWSRLGLWPERTLFKDTHQVVRHRQTHDWDMTESQPAWRNLGVDVPDFPHWLHPSLGVVGRTNLVGRARCDAALRTAVTIANASGDLRYRTPATVEVAVFDRDGRRAAATLALPPFGQRTLWLDELIPDLPARLGPDGIGALQIRSPHADLNAQMIGLTPEGSVSLQHLWGY